MEQTIKNRWAQAFEHVGIGQHDYTRIEIEDITALTDAEKAKIAEKVANGTIFDCLIVTSDFISRVIGHNDTVIAIANIGNAAILEVAFGE